MRRCVVLTFALAWCASAQVPVHFRFAYELSGAEVATGLLGSMNNWGLPPSGWYLVFQDEDQDHVWRGSLLLAPGTYLYKFVSLSSLQPEVSPSYPHVTGWYPDPLNPLTDGSAYQNSVLRVTDPMVYYLLPPDSSQVEDPRPLLSANFSASVATGLVVESIRMVLDGQDLTSSASWDSATGCLSCPCPQDLALGWHTLTVSCANGAGAVAQATSRFRVIPGPPRMDVRFVLDAHSPHFLLPTPVQAVKVTGSFCTWGVSPARFTDPEGDGVWEGTVRLEIGRVFQYRFVVNGTLYVPDPDNPSLQLRPPGDWFVSVGRANPSGSPRFLDLASLQGSIFRPGDAPSVRVGILPGDWGSPVRPDSVQVWFDGEAQAVSPAQAGDTVLVGLTLPPLASGLHSLRVRAVDTFGRQGSALFSFGAYPPGGFHAVDAFEDDQGPGRYRYPQGVAGGAADIRAFHVGASTKLDPQVLHLVVEMAAVDAHTAVGVLVCPSLEGSPVPLPGSLEVMGPGWQGRGAFMWLVSPSSPFFQDAHDNRLLWSASGAVGPPVGINPDPENSGTFFVSLPLADLEGRLGTYTGTWYWGVVATLRTVEGEEVGPDRGGWPAEEDPDVYDAAFFSVPGAQGRILGGWIHPDSIGGPRLAALTRVGRGLLALPRDSIQGLPEGGPEVLFYSAGATLIWPQFTVRGVVADPTVTSGLFRHHRQSWLVPIDGGVFQVPVTLTEGVNYVGLEVTDAQGRHTVAWARYDYRPKARPQARIRVETSSQTVVLDGGGSFSPGGGIVSYSWAEEPGNPSVLGIAGCTSPQVSFSLPRPWGEYAVRLTVSDGRQEGWAVATVVVDSTAHPLGDTHPRWAADRVVYEVYPVAYASPGDLDAITRDLPRIKGMGAGVLWLTPICESPEAHGYAITDYFRVNPSLGDSLSLATLVSAAHQEGLKVILDLVINHTSVVHPFMRDALRYGAHSIFHPYYLWNPDGTYQSYWPDLPNLNYGTPEVWDYFIEVSRFWIQAFDVDGYRCDVAWGIQDRAPQFWRAWRDSLKVVKDNLLLLAEASADDDSLFQGRFDAAYDWGYLTLLRDVLRGTREPGVLHSHLASLPGWGWHPLALRFLENHDETRFIAEFGVERTKLAAALLFTSPGLPLVYAGQEVGETSPRYYISWDDPFGLQSYYRGLGRIREALECLRWGEYAPVPCTSPAQVYAFSRHTPQQRVFVAANCKGLALSTTLSLPTDSWGLDPGASWVVSDLLAGTTQVATTEDLASFPLVLAPSQVVVAAVAESAVVGIREPAPFPVLQVGVPRPNPSRGWVSLPVALSRPGPAVLEVWDLAGRLVAREERWCSAGHHVLRWEWGGGVAPGCYVLRVRAHHEQDAKPVVVVR